jgi:hypothetical protein
MSSHLRSRLGIQGVKATLLRECLPTEAFYRPSALAVGIKALPITLQACRPIDEAISTAGGVLFEGLTEHFMISNKPGVFVAGEMLDWEAPTGGYLLQATFSTAVAAADGAVAWIRTHSAAPSGSAEI